MAANSVKLSDIRQMGRPARGIKAAMVTARTVRNGVLALALSAAVVSAGCSTRVHNRGHVIDPVAINEIAAGFHGMSDIEGILGTPSTMGTFDHDVWYYISEQTEQRAFFDPKVKTRQILAVHYDANGRVSSIEQYGLEDAKNVAIVERETPTAGNDTTILQELFGDIGRFANPPSRQGPGNLP